MRTVFRWLKRLLLAATVLAVAALAWLYVQDPVLTTRLVSAPFGGGSGPTEVVFGSPPAELPEAGETNRSIDANTLRKVVEFGAGNRTHALLIWHDGKLQLEQYYSGHDRNQITPTQSMHKSVLALLVGIAVDEGHIGSVDDPAAKYLPEWAQDERAQITVRQMLQQASGIDFPSYGPDLLDDFYQLMIGGNVEPVAVGRPLQEPPGQRFDYNNFNAQNLGIILERATGQAYADYLSNALWRRLGAGDATVVLDSLENGMARTFCCLGAPARAWLQLGLLHLNRGQLAGRQVVPASWMREVITPSPANPNYGYLTWLGTKYEPERRYNSKGAASVPQSEPFAVDDLIYFDGFGGQRMYASPSLGLVIVRTGDMTLNWDEAWLVNSVIRGISH